MSAGTVSAAAGPISPNNLAAFVFSSRLPVFNFSVSPSSSFSSASKFDAANHKTAVVINRVDRIFYVPLL